MQTGQLQWTIYVHVKVANTHTGSEAWRGSAVLPGLPRAVPHHLAVDGAADAIMQLHVELGQNVGCTTNDDIYFSVQGIGGVELWDIPMFLSCTE